MSAAVTHVRRFTPSVAQILAAVSTEFGIPVRDILGRSRLRSIAMARHITIFVTRRLLGMSLPELARNFAFRDHTTPMYACHRMAAMIDTDVDMRARILRVELEALHLAQRAAAQ